MTAPVNPAWDAHAPLPWSVDDMDPKCVRDRRWNVVVDLMTGNDEADQHLAQLIADAANAHDAKRLHAEREIRSLVDAVTGRADWPEREAIAAALYEHDHPEPRLLWPPQAQHRTVQKYLSRADAVIAARPASSSSNLTEK